MKAVNITDLLEKAKFAIDADQIEISALRRVIEKAQQRLDGYRAVLAWYADEDNWRGRLDASYVPCADIDRGKRAKAALSDEPVRINPEDDGCGS